MKRKTVTAFLMSLCLVLTVPGTVYASEIQSAAAEAQSAEEEPPEDPEAGQEEKKEETPAEEKNEVAKAEESRKTVKRPVKKIPGNNPGKQGMMYRIRWIRLRQR